MNASQRRKPSVGSPNAGKALARVNESKRRAELNAFSADPSSGAKTIGGGGGGAVVKKAGLHSSQAAAVQRLHLEATKSAVSRLSASNAKVELQLQKLKEDVDFVRSQSIASAAARSEQRRQQQHQQQQRALGPTADTGDQSFAVSTSSTSNIPKRAARLSMRSVSAPVGGSTAGARRGRLGASALVDAPQLHPQSNQRAEPARYSRNARSLSPVETQHRMDHGGGGGGLHGSHVPGVMESDARDAVWDSQAFHTMRTIVEQGARLSLKVTSPSQLMHSIYHHSSS